MEELYQAFKVSHVAAGFFSLVLFWIPALSKKGSKLHNKSGLAYLYCMGYTVVTAFILCLFVWEKAQLLALFLLFLSMVSANPLVHGYLYIKKKRLSENWRRVSLVFNVAMALLGIFLLYQGYVLNGHTMAYVFGGIALAAGAANINNFRKARNVGFLNAHLTNMIFSGGAAYTAFLAFGARTYLEAWFGNSWLGIIPWLLPTLLAIVAVRILRPKYETSKV